MVHNIRSKNGQVLPTVQSDQTGAQMNGSSLNYSENKVLPIMYGLKFNLLGLKESKKTKKLWQNMQTRRCKGTFRILLSIILLKASHSN